MASKNRQNAEENEIIFLTVLLSCLLVGSHLQSGIFQELPAQIPLLVWVIHSPNTKQPAMCHSVSLHTASPWWQKARWETVKSGWPRNEDVSDTTRTKCTGDLMFNFFFFVCVNHQLTSLWDVWKIAKSSPEWKNQFPLKTGYLPTLGRASIFVLSLSLKIRCRLDGLTPVLIFLKGVFVYYV